MHGMHDWNAIVAKIFSDDDAKRRHAIEEIKDALNRGLLDDRLRAGWLIAMLDVLVKEVKRDL